MTLSDELLSTIEIAKKAGQILLDYCARDYKVWHKADRSPVTDADMAAHTAITKALRAGSSYPILSEEGIDDGSQMGSDYLWVVDPLDGTKDFIKHSPDFSVLIGLIYRHEPILGVVYVPSQHLLFCAERGHGAYSQFHNRMPRPMTVSATAKLSDMTLVMSRSNVEAADLEIARALECEYIMRVGSVGHKLALIADGDSDLYINTRPKVSEWDTCASEIILREAGGTITDITGNNLSYNRQQNIHRNGIVASNGRAHGEIVAKVQEIVGTRKVVKETPTFLP